MAITAENQNPREIAKIVSLLTKKTQRPLRKERRGTQYVRICPHGEQVPYPTKTKAQPELC